MKFMIGDLPVLFPYDRIYPGKLSPEHDAWTCSTAR